MKPKLHFSRFEFKYVLPLAQRSDLESELGYFMALDPYVSSKRHQKYFVRSLYFDDDSYTAYYEKTDGIMIRRKYRIRTYTDDSTEECVIFLEVKGRFNSLVYKHRVELPRSVVRSLEVGSEDFLSDLVRLNNSDDVATAFLFDSFRRRLKPRLLVDYERRPYVSKYAPDFRVTFDDSLETTVTGRLFSEPTDRQRITLPGFSIIEVKFKRHIPSWFHRLIQSYELHRISVSKYCKGMERTGLAENLE
jgi:hypothetical protein